MTRAMWSTWIPRAATSVATSTVDFAGPEVSNRPLALGLAAVSVYRPGGQPEVPQMSGHPVSTVLCPHKDHRRTRPANKLGAQRSPIGARHRPELMAGSAYFGL